MFFIDRMTQSRPINKRNNRPVRASLEVKPSRIRSLSGWVQVTCSLSARSLESRHSGEDRDL
jgi:hypothetical protein